jgi:hypothetical protein
MDSFTYKKQASGVAENGHTSATSQNTDDGSTSVTGSFFEILTSSEFYKNTKVHFFLFQF